MHLVLGGKHHEPWTGWSDCHPYSREIWKEASHWITGGPGVHRERLRAGKWLKRYGFLSFLKDREARIRWRKESQKRTEHSRRARKEDTEASLKGRQLDRESEGMRENPRNPGAQELCKWECAFRKGTRYPPGCILKTCNECRQRLEGRSRCRCGRSYPWHVTWLFTHFLLSRSQQRKCFHGGYFSHKESEAGRV